MIFEHIKCPLNCYTFKVSKIKKWVENNCFGKVLNLYCGKTLLDIKDEFRNDINFNMPADYHMDALECVKFFMEDNIKFDTIILDPPYSERKSMEYYEGKFNSRFKNVKDLIPNILSENGKVITFGYQSVNMGKKRGFEIVSIVLFSHGGAIHDTIASVEEKLK